MRTEVDMACKGRGQVLVEREEKAAAVVVVDEQGVN